MDLAEFIATQRKKRGWSQQALANAIGVSKGLVGQWEARYSEPPLPRILDLCAAFGISAESVIGPGGPLHGQIVQDAEELALLRLWRRLKPDDRDLVLRMLRGAGLPVGEQSDEPDPPRKRANVD